MKRSAELVDLFMPWTGLIIGFVALCIAHQFGSDGVFDHCEPIGPGPLLIVSVIGIIATLGAALVSWRVFRDDNEAPSRKLIATISIGSASFFTLAMIFPMIAAVMLPPCFE